MLRLDCLSEDKPVSVFIALLFAEEVLSIFEEKHPKDLRLRKAMESAKHWLSERTSEAADAANAAAYAASDAAADAAAANAAYGVAYAAAYAAAAAYGVAYAAAYAAANTAAYAADAAAADAAADAAYAADAAADAAYAAADAARAAAAAYAAVYTAIASDAHNREEFIHSILLRHLDQIIQFHIEEKQSMRNPDEVFKWLSDESREDFIYNMDILC